MLSTTIIVQAQRGDPQAFQQIVEAYQGVLWRTARVLLRDAALTEDVVQEAWIDAWRGLPRLHHPQVLQSWLLTTVANRCRMASRRSLLATVSLESDPEVQLVPDDSETMLDQIARLETPQGKGEIISPAPGATIHLTEPLYSPGSSRRRPPGQVTTVTIRYALPIPPASASGGRLWASCLCCGAGRRSPSNWRLCADRCPSPLWLWGRDVPLWNAWRDSAVSTA